MIQNLDPAEINKFNDLASHWWAPEGEFKTLHKINPLRLNFINERATLSGKRVLDVRCGGGILTESMAKAGADVTGIDLAEDVLNAARVHAKGNKLNINYELLSAEEFAEQHPTQFDVVTCLEMLEHVPDPASIIRACAHAVKPDGDVFFSTINRTAKAYAFAIIGAEYLLKIIPKRTHDYEKFIRPAELDTWCREAGLQLKELKGLKYNPFTHECSLTEDVSVNYLMHCKKV